MNTKLIRLGALSLGLLASLVVVSTTNAQESGQVDLTINTGTSTCKYGTAINLGQQAVAPDFGALTFVSNFTGSNGDNTWSCTDYDGTPAGWDLTIQAGNLGNGLGNSINANLISISHGAPTMTAGNCAAAGSSATDVAIDTEHPIIAKAATASERTVCTVTTSGVSLKVAVPANQAPGSYTGALTITLPVFN